MDIPYAAPQASEELCFQTKRHYVAVLPHESGVEERITVLSVAGEELCLGAESELAPEVLVPQQGRVDRAEGAASQAEAASAPVEVLRPLRAEMHCGSGGILLSRLQASGFLAIIQRYHGYPTGGEAPEVHLHVLGVVHLDTIQEYADMLAS